METFSIGALIKGLRENMQITQEDLAGDYFDRCYISKIERGKVMPSKSTLEMLFDRLSQDPKTAINYFIVDEQTLAVQKLKDTIDIHISRGRIEYALRTIAELESNTQYMQHRVSQQYILKSKAAVMSLKGEDPALVIAKLEEAIAITIYNLDVKDISKNLLLLQQDYMILTSIAKQYNRKGELSTAITIMEALVHNMKARYISTSTKCIIYPKLICDLTKYLYKAHLFEECIDKCNEGIREALEIGVTVSVVKISEIKAICLIETNRREKGEPLIRQVHAAYLLFKEDYKAGRLKKIAKDYGIEL